MRKLWIASAMGLGLWGCGGDDAGRVADAPDLPGEVDATTPDATTPDATTPDATTPDATTPDATTPDATTPDATPDGEVTISEWGLDQRPSVTTCRAFERPQLAQGGAVAYGKAFPNMDFEGRAIGLVRTRIGPDGPLRWFVLDRLGAIWTFVGASASKDGLAADGTTAVERAELYLELPETPYGTGGEGGLLGFDFDPEFALRADANYVYVHYTTWPDNNVWRFRVGPRGNADAPWQIVEAKRIFVTESGGGNHWGGDLKFGPDGYLYISLGDGGNGMNAGDAVKTTWLRGKILRIDPRGPRSADADTPYLIPPGNPFAAPGAPLCDARDLTDNRVDCPEIFARGFRNPWRMSFDRETGQLWVGDVGSGKEEVNLVLAGYDYGWNRCDGRNPRNSCPPLAETAHIAPIAQYRVYNSASVAGGFVYRGVALGSALQGAYLFTDVYNGELLVIDEPYKHVTLPADAAGLRVSQVYEHPDESDEDDLPKFRKLDAARLSYPVSWAEDEHAELYVVTFGSGKGEGVFKLVPPGGTPADDSVPATLTATGCVAADEATRPAPGMLRYELNAPFWSDGADKARYLAIPDGATIGVGADDWALPSGSVVTKTFYLDQRPVETRLMVRHDDGGWAGYTYVWRADGSDADKASSAGEQRVWGDQTWAYPSRAGCMACHTAGAGFTLGLETRQLDRLHTYVESGRTANQIATLSHIGLFAAPLAPDPDAAFVAPFGDAPLAVRARTYLHTNCAQCHREATVPDLRFDTALAQTGLCDQQRLVPGAPATSKLVTRMRSGDPAVRMPRGAGLVIDDAGVALLEAWISDLTSCP